MTDIKPKSVNFFSQINSRDYYKGTSFRWAGEWEPGKLYSNDTFFVDFVSYYGKVYVCVKSHYASNTVAPGNSEYWNLAVNSEDVDLSNYYTKEESDSRYLSAEQVGSIIVDGGETTWK